MKERVKNFYPKMWDVHCKEEAEILPVEKRQEFMDYITKGRMSIGEARIKADLNFDQAAGITMMQIKSRTYLDYQCT